MPLPTMVQMEDEHRRMEEMEVELPIGVMEEHLLLLDIISRYDSQVYAQFEISARSYEK